MYRFHNMMNELESDDRHFSYLPQKRSPTLQEQRLSYMPQNRSGGLQERYRSYMPQHRSAGLHEQPLSYMPPNEPGDLQPQTWRTPNEKLGVSVVYNKDCFQVHLDVQHFTPEELLVKVVDKYLVVEGKHDEKEDQHGYVQRQFTRKYILPEGHNIDAIAPSLSSDGILTVTVPKIGAVQCEERFIPITQTGPNVRPGKDKKTGAKKKTRGSRY